MTARPYLTLYNLASENEDDETEYLINGILPKKGLVVILGAYGTGKTQLAMRMAGSIAAGTLFGDGKAKIDDVPLDFCFPTIPGYTLYLAGEGIAHIKSRIISTRLALASHEAAILRGFFKDFLPIIPIKVNVPLSGTDQIPEIERIVYEVCLALPQLGNRPALIVFDTLSASLFIKDENNNSEMQKIANMLHAYAEHFKCCVVVVTHPPKSNDGPKGYSRGASALANSADVVIEIKKINASKQREVRIVKMRDGPYEGTQIRFKIESFGSAPALVALKMNETSEAQKTATANVMNERQKMVYEILKSKPDGLMEQSAVIKKLLSLRSVTTGLESEKRASRRDISKMQDMGWVLIEKVGKGSIIRLKEKCCLPFVDQNI